MASQSRKHRGYATQRLAALWFATYGWPYAYSKGAGESGIDIENMPGLSPEVKATPGDVTGALAQAHRNRGGGVPFVVWRPNGYGPERIDSWPVIMRLDDFTTLLHSAGYGDAPPAAAPSLEEFCPDTCTMPDGHRHVRLTIPASTSLPNPEEKCHKKSSFGDDFCGRHPSQDWPCSA